ncbi:MAG: hypothetical protein ACK4SX_08760 [Alcanivoracaceae bacterium]
MLAHLAPELLAAALLVGGQRHPVASVVADPRLGRVSIRASGPVV